MAKRGEGVGGGGVGGKAPRAAGSVRSDGDPRPMSARGRSDTADAFLPDPGDGPVRVDDDLAEALAEDYLTAATSGDDSQNQRLDEVVPEDLGGPFVESSASDEFALGTDESNPEDAEPEPLPRAVHGLATRPR